MNGTESYPKKLKGEALERKRKEHREIHQEIGQELLSCTGLKVSPIFAGADLNDLAELIKPEVERFLLGTEAKRSQLREVGESQLAEAKKKAQDAMQNVFDDEGPTKKASLDLDTASPITCVGPHALDCGQAVPLDD